MRIYIDLDYKCHTTNPDGTFREFEVEFFNTKCNTFVEGYLYVPAGESWTREDGEVFSGEMVAPLIDFVELDEVQRRYERQLIVEYETALSNIETALEV